MMSPLITIFAFLYICECTEIREEGCPQVQQTLGMGEGARLKDRRMNLIRYADRRKYI